MKGFEDALQAVLASEGGLSDNPADRGGRTNYGITQPVYDGWRRQHAQPAQKVDQVSPAETRAIYLDQYWEPLGCEALPWPVSLCHFDAGVQHGLRYASILLQRAAGVAEDGRMGPQTLAAAQSLEPGLLVRRMVRGRLDYYRKIVLANRGQQVFMAGWLSRVLTLWARCIADMPEAE